MNSEIIMQTEVLDILFEKRNKAYGAYTLRKFYNTRLLQSIAIMMGVVIVFSAFTFLPKTTSDDELIVKDQIFARIAPAPRAPEVKPPIVKPPAKKPAATLKMVSRVVIVNNRDTVDFLHDLKDRAIGSTTSLLPPDEADQLVPSLNTGSGPGVAPPIPAPPALDVTAPMVNPEIMPEFPGGIAALRRFLMKNLHNPRDLNEGELISVKVKFVVGYDGTLKSFDLVEDGGEEFNKEVLRVLKKMPQWIPGKTRGQNVSVYYTIPVKFIAEQ